MGYSREQIAAEAEKNFHKFTIDDGPNGEIDIISIFRAPPNIQDMVRDRQKELVGMQDEESEATVEELHEAVIRVMEPLASSSDDLREYVAEFPTSDLLTLYQLWGEATQPSKSA